MKEELNIIVLKIADIGKELNRKFGTDSYKIRCALFDIKDELSKLSQHDVSVSVCEHPYKFITGIKVDMPTCQKCGERFY